MPAPALTVPKNDTEYIYLASNFLRSLICTLPATDQCFTKMALLVATPSTGPPSKSPSSAARAALFSSSIKLSHTII